MLKVTFISSLCTLATNATAVISLTLDPPKDILPNHISSMDEHEHPYTFSCSRLSQVSSFCRRLSKIPCRFQEPEPQRFIFGTQVTKLVRANKFVLDTVMYKVGEDAISDAFSRAADAADNTQV